MVERDRAAPRRRGRLALRVAGSAVLLTVVVLKAPDFDARELVPRWTAATAWWLLGAAALTLAGIVLSSMRWQAVLAALGVRARLRQLLNHYLAGQFVSNVLPTTIGGDVLRVSLLARETGESPRTVASVVRYVPFDVSTLLPTYWRSMRGGEKS